MNVEKMTVTELKALVYDEGRKLEIAQSNIQFLNKEIAKKESEVKEEFKENKDDK